MMKKVFFGIAAISKAEERKNSNSGKFYKWQKFVALFLLYNGISVGFGGLITICGGYFLSANFSEINQYGAGMIFIAFALIAVAIHALDRIHNPAE